MPCKICIFVWLAKNLPEREKFLYQYNSLWKEEKLSLGQYNSFNLAVKIMGWDLNEVNSFLFWGSMEESAVFCSCF